MLAGSLSFNGLVFSSDFETLTYRQAWLSYVGEVLRLKFKKLVELRFLNSRSIENELGGQVSVQSRSSPWYFQWRSG